MFNSRKAVFKYFFTTISGFFFFLTAFVYLLQLIPFTGIYLMFLMAPFWSVITLNLAFMSLLVECLMKKRPRWAIVIPSLYFLGYFTLTLSSHLSLFKLKNDITAFNKNVSVPFNKDINDLVLNGYYDHTPFLTKYGLKQVSEGTYDKDKNKKYLTNFLVGEEICKEAAELRKNREFRAPYFNQYLKVPLEKARRKRTIITTKTVYDKCLVRIPKVVNNAVFVEKSEFEEVESFLLARKIGRITVTTSEGEEFLLKTGFANPYQWLPMPVMGCGLNSARPSWDCSVGFMRERSKSLSEDYTIFQVLNLKSIPKEEWYKISNLQVNLTEMAKAKIQAKKDEGFREFEKFLTDPINYSKSLRFDAIENEKEYFASRSLQLVDALDQLKNVKDNYGAKRREISVKISKLPPAVFKKHSDQLIKIFDLAEQENWIWHNKELYIRLADLGGKAHPIFLKDLAKEKNALKFNPAIGYAICRAGREIGQSVKEKLIPFAERLEGTSQHYNQKRPIFLALSRTGYAEEIRKIFSDKNKKYIFVDGEITSNSPASVCVDFKGNPDFDY